MARINLKANFTILFLFIFGVSLFFFLINHSVEPRINDVDFPALTLLNEIDSLPSSLQANSESPLSEVIEINDATDIFNLEVDSRFSLRAGETESDTVVLMQVSDISKNPTFTQIQARGIYGEIAVITVTPSLTNILLKTSVNIFEYIGGNFDGTMRRVAQVDIEDDIHHSKPIAKPIKNTLQPKRVTER